MSLLMKASHPLIGAGLTAGLALATGNWWLGAAVAIALFAGREHAQAEYRWIERYGKRFQTPAEYAEWHYINYGKAEGRLPLESWDAYYAANPDLHTEWLKLVGLRANMPWWGGFDKRVWDLHSLLGVVLPTVTAVTLALLFG